MVTLLLVCKTSHDWIIPLLYRSVTLSHSEQIAKFHTAHDTSEGSHPHYHRIFHLWIGAIHNFHSDLGYGSSTWPITTVASILNVSTNLKSLYLLCLDQNLWCYIEDAIPTSLESLTMGPVHGSFRINDMKHRPCIQKFTSASSHMRDSEIKDFILSSHCRSFRFILPTLELLDLSQVALISQSKTLQVMEIVVCHCNDFLLPEYQARLEQTTNDPRILMTSLCDEYYHKDWSEFLRHEFLLEERNHLVRIPHNPLPLDLLSTDSPG